MNCFESHPSSQLQCHTSERSRRPALSRNTRVRITEVQYKAKYGRVRYLELSHTVPQMGHTLIARIMLLPRMKRPLQRYYKKYPHYACVNSPVSVYCANFEACPAMKDIRALRKSARLRNSHISRRTYLAGRSTMRVVRKTVVSKGQGGPV